VNLTRYQLEWCVFGVRQALRLSKLTRVQARPELFDLLKQLEDMMLISEFGSETHSGIGESKQDDLVDTAEAAALLGITSRRVRQIAPDLGGWRCGWGYVFPRANVIEYANGRHCA
jgi:hypothetical protein